MKKDNDQGQNYRSMGILFSTGATMAAAVLIGFFLGKYLDRWLGTEPWLTVVMFVLGVAAGLKAVYNMAFPKQGGTGDDG